jgi:hypothetical protein
MIYLEHGMIIQHWLFTRPRGIGGGGEEAAAIIISLSACRKGVPLSGETIQSYNHQKRDFNRQISVDDDNIDVVNDNDKDSGELSRHHVVKSFFKEVFVGIPLQAQRTLNEACKMQSSSFNPSKKERLLDN